MDVVNIATKTNQMAIKSVVDEINANTKNGSSVIKSIQRGVVEIYPSSGTRYIYISTINPEKSTVNLYGTSQGGQNTYLPHVVSLLEDTLILSVNTYNTSSYQFSWEIVEFY